MSTIFLIGRHGSGKSTIGLMLAKSGYTHVSVGLLRRLARLSQFPADIPAVLMAALSRSRPGEPLSIETAIKLLRFVQSQSRCVVDGFPASVEHVALLPPNSRIGVVVASRSVRTERLMHRSTVGQRQWTEGRESARELALLDVIRASKESFAVTLLRNQSSSPDALEKLAARLLQGVGATG